METVNGSDSGVPVVYANTCLSFYWHRRQAPTESTRARIAHHRLSWFASRQFVQLEWDGTEIEFRQIKWDCFQSVDICMLLMVAKHYCTLTDWFSCVVFESHNT